MKKTYTVKATKRAWLKIVADENATQDEIYELAKAKVTNGKPKWEEPTFNITRIHMDEVPEGIDVKTKVSLLRAIDPLTGKIKK